MTDRAICYACIHDSILSERIESDGETQLCEVCGEDTKNAFSYTQLGAALEPIVREHYEVGPLLRKFYDDDSEGWEQDGELLSDIAQTVLGQDVDDPDELVTAVAAAEHYWPGDGGEQFYDTSQLYVRRRTKPHGWIANWHDLKTELAHRRRFFSDRARALFVDLFQDVSTVEAFDQEAGDWQPVVSELPRYTTVMRARVVRSDAELRSYVESAAQELGAPPAGKAHAGRMNAAGVSVFYGAMDSETCVAEMRPVLGGRILVGAFQTTRPLRIIDFRRLEAAYLGDLSYFDPDYSRHRERASFLRRLHGLISMPVVPGHEDEYLVTQTLAEYLAHVHAPPLDGIFFRSVQRDGGTNIVIFGRDEFEQEIEGVGTTEGISYLPLHASLGLGAQGQIRFPVEYIDGSAKLFATRTIKYQHQELSFWIYEDFVSVHDDHEDHDDGDWD